MQIHPISSDKTPPHVQASRTRFLRGLKWPRYSQPGRVLLSGAFLPPCCSPSTNITGGLSNFQSGHVKETEKNMHVLGLRKYKVREYELG